MNDLPEYSEPRYLNGDVINAVIAERAAQIQKWSQAHDVEEHSTGGLAAAACVLAQPSAEYQHHILQGLPFGNSEIVEMARNKRSTWNRRRQLIVAAALIIAEIERIDASELTKTDEP